MVDDFYTITDEGKSIALKSFQTTSQDANVVELKWNTDDAVQVSHMNYV